MSILQTATQAGRRYRQLRALWSMNDMGEIVDRLRGAAAEKLRPKQTALPVRRDDILTADLSRNAQISIPEMVPGKPLLINWVMVPPGPGSGGHTTIFRMIRYLEAHGYVNRVYFYNIYGADHRYYESILRHYYGFHGYVGDADREMEDAHAVFATAWSTAYCVFNSRCRGKRFYFVQDYEPYFHSVGAASLLAENTYRMGFHAVTAGKWLAQKLAFDFGMTADFFNFGCDTSTYYRSKNSKRSGLVFYARREATRRGFELGLLALELFASRRPEVPLHFYGEAMGTLPFRFIDHGHVSPAKLNDIYNQCYAGLSLSLTNVSLVPHEMLAAGCIPVVNDAVQNRLVLDNPFVRYAQPYPQALVDELDAIVTDSDFDFVSDAASASVMGTTWDQAGEAVDLILRKSLSNEIAQS
jgi:glycosyltransferase involved in cell wall biosynthesis